MKIIWHIQQAIHIGIWTFLIYRGLSIQIIEGWYGLAFFASLQMLQYFFISEEIGKLHNFSRGQTVVLTLLFGYSWWFPLKNTKPQ